MNDAPAVTELHTGRFASPVGTLLLAWRGESLCSLWFDDREELMTAALHARFGAVTVTPAADLGVFRQPLEEYFAGEIAALDRIAVDTGGTPFQQSVWRLLRSIPAGTTTT